MTITDWIKMLEAIANNHKVLIPFQLMSRGELNAIINLLGGPEKAVEYFKMVELAEVPSFDDI